MMIEEFFDLRIATIEPGEPEPKDAHLVRIEDPTLDEVKEFTANGWFHKPCYVTYVIDVPASLDEYIQTMFKARQRNKPRRLLREVPERYRLEVDSGGSLVPQFQDLYHRTVVDRPRGKDRLKEHHGTGFGPEWTGFYLFDREAMVAGILVNQMRRHLSVAYGAFDRVHSRKLDLEHFLLMQVLQRSIDSRHRMMSLGMDTNRYGHHLSLQLPVYKLRIGFTPLAYEPAGTELLRINSFDVFEEGLFFYSYRQGWLVGNYFHRGKPDLRPYRHHQAPDIVPHQI